VPRGLLAIVAPIAALIAAGCAGGYEQALLAQFFTASRLLDRTALQTISTSIFDPRTDGTVLRFDVDRIAPEDHGEKRVTVTATVHRPSGETVPETLIVTMRRANQAVDPGATSEWFITRVAQAK
jgi:hypothetical protein